MAAAVRLPRGAAEAVGSSLIPWFRANARDLPWRRDRSPYAVWVSELMLQQTRVETVVPYFERWMQRFPDCASLAAAPLGDVLKAWEGLGYYARARNLHAAAKRVCADFGGQLPSGFEQLRSLPGIGPYTAAAIASFAFGGRHAVLDGNVERVLTRFCAIDAPLKAPATQRGLRDLADRLLGDADPALFNEAMMELGALVCAPRESACGACPLRGPCRGRRGNPTDYPTKAATKPVPTLVVGAAVTWRDDGKFLIALRHPKGLLGGLWEFPGGKREPGESLPDCVRRELKEELDIDVEVLGPACQVRHTYSHFHLDLRVFHCRWRGDKPKALDCAGFRWATLADCADLAFGKADLGVLRHLRESGGGPLRKILSA
jgi:A/G-specific adenine glycosylase